MPNDPERNVRSELLSFSAVQSGNRSYLRPANRNDDRFGIAGSDPSTILELFTVAYDSTFDKIVSIATAYQDADANPFSEAPTRQTLLLQTFRHIASMLDQATTLRETNASLAQNCFNTANAAMEKVATSTAPSLHKADDVAFLLTHSEGINLFIQSYEYAATTSPSTEQGLVKLLRTSIHSLRGNEVIKSLESYVKAHKRALSTKKGHGTKALLESVTNYDQKFTLNSLYHHLSAEKVMYFKPNSLLTPAMRKGSLRDIINMTISALAHLEKAGAYSKKNSGDEINDSRVRLGATVFTIIELVTDPKTVFMHPAMITDLRAIFAENPQLAFKLYEILQRLKNGDTNRNRKISGGRSQYQTQTHLKQLLIAAGFEHLFSDSH